MDVATSVATRSRFGGGSQEHPQRLLAGNPSGRVHGLSDQSEGFVGRRPDGRFGFVRIDHVVRLQTDAEHEDAARDVVAKAEQGCLVTVSLDLPVQTTVEVRTSTGVA